MSNLEFVRALTSEERDNARENAYRVIIGNAPKRDSFVQTIHSKFPPMVRSIITAMCMFALVLAFLPSAMRLHYIGSLTFAETIPDSASAEVAGWSMVFLAETGQVVFLLALAIMGATPMQRRILIAFAFLSTSIALVGNLQVARPMMQGEMFAWLEAIAPPMIVLGTAYILKEQILHAIELRYASQRDFDAALNAWKERSMQPEQDASWEKRYANAIRDALRKANNRSERGRAAIAALSHGDWYALVKREMQIDNWYLQGAQSDAQLQTEQVQKLQQLEAHNANLQDAIERLQSTRTASNYVGVHTGEVSIVQEGELHDATCPHCGFHVQKATHRAASNALAAHLRGCKTRKQMQGSDA
jgi:hypothetical protein